MILQVKRSTIWDLYVKGHRRLPFKVIHHGPTSWHRDIIVSIHRKFKVGKIDKVTMYHLQEHGFDIDSERNMFEELTRAMNKTREENKLGLATPVLCEHFAEPIWYRVGRGWRIVRVVDNQEEDATLV